MIVLVDDDDWLLGELAEALRADGHEVEAYSDSAVALQRIEEAAPELVVCDVRMPGMTGFDLRRRMTRRHGAHPSAFLFLSSSADPDSQVIGLELGADDFMVKPVNMAVLRAKVRAILRRHRAWLQPAFEGALGDFPMPRILQFCETRGITGEVEVEAGELQGTIGLSGGRLVESPESTRFLTRVLDLTEGTFRIRVHRPDFAGLTAGHAAAASREPRPAPPDRPAGLLSSVRAGSRLIQLQTEVAERPTPSVVTLVMLDGRALHKRVTQLPDGAEPDLAEMIRTQHAEVEQETRDRLGRKARGEAEPAPLVVPEPEAAAASPGVGALLDEGLTRFLSGDYPGAAAAWERAAALEPDNATVQVNLAILRLRMGPGG